MTNFRALLNSMLILSALILTVSCGEEMPIITLPTADFDFVVADDNSGLVTFNNLSKDADSYSWDFGDGSGTSTETSPSYTFAESGNYSVSLRAVNSDGQNAVNMDVSVTVLANVVELVAGGDMTDESVWTFRQVWSNDDNKVDHAFVDEAFKWDNSDGILYSQSYLYQEVAVEADKSYKFSANIAAPAGTKDIWFELYFGNADPATEDDYSSNGLRLYVSSFDDPASGCANDPFDGDFVEVSQACVPAADQTKIINSDGSFSLSAEELTADGTIFIVFKSGSWDSADNYKDGINLDNISIIEL